MNAQAPVTQVCKKCGEEKALELFSKSYRKPGEYAGNCKACVNKQRKETRDRDKEKGSASFAAKQEKKRARRRLHYLQNRDRILQREKVKYQELLKDPEYLRKRARQFRLWVEANPLRAAITKARCSDRSRGINPDAFPGEYYELKAYRSLINRELRSQKDEERS